MIYSYYFSASGTTEDIVRSIAGNIGGGDDAVVVHHNLTGMRAETAPEPDRDDVVLFAAPVYGGRLPAMAAERFRRIRGAGQKCVAVVVYGNRDYEDALLELHDILSENGFVVVAAGAFVARHKQPKQHGRNSPLRHPSGHPTQIPVAIPATNSEGRNSTPTISISFISLLLSSRTAGHSRKLRPDSPRSPTRQSPQQVSTLRPLRRSMQPTPIPSAINDNIINIRLQNA